MGKRGRKSGFNEKVRETFLRLLAKGNTEVEIADIIGVTTRTLQLWKGKNADLLRAVKEAKHAADQLVEASLFSRATGYSHPETKVFCSEGSIVTHEMEKHYPPDTQAAMFWLRNRQPERWREKTEGDVTVNNNLSLNGMTDAQLDAKIESLMAKKKKGA